MSELINNSSDRIKKLKSLLLKLHGGSASDDVKTELTALLGSVPYGEVVQAEQELIDEGMPPSEIQKYCDLHSQALKDNIDLTYSKDVPAGHPVHTLKMENRAIESELSGLENIFIKIKFNSAGTDFSAELLKIRHIFNNLMDIEKHYVKKENIIFSILEKYGVTGPSTVMWGKDDEVRSFLKSSLSLAAEEVTDAAVIQGFVDMMFAPAVSAVREMIDKEEKILFPMCLDKFTDLDWYNVYAQGNDVGYCLYVPEDVWKPEDMQISDDAVTDNSKVRFDTGSFSVEELESMLNCIPLDITFVDKDDKVKFFSHGKQRIFERSKAILGRLVQYCHPPSSVHIVDKIIDDFKTGKQSEAKFWIPFKGMFVHIAYYAVRDKQGNYLGTAEVTQDITHFKNAEGERRLLTYDE